MNDNICYRNIISIQQLNFRFCITLYFHFFCPLISTMKKISDFTVLRAFRSVNYTLYFIGRAVSQFGTWMQRTAVIWVVYSITHSAFLLGVTIFAEQFPSFLFSIFGGGAADRYDRYKVIKITQITSMIQAILLALLVITGHTIVWAILVLSVILGIINAFDVPARQALVHDVVADQADLPNALSLTTATASLAQLLGPALAGIVLVHLAQVFVFCSMPQALARLLFRCF